MKYARIIFCVCIAVGLVSLAGDLAFLAKTTSSTEFEEKWSGDFGLRYNEICCIGDGINPYDISDGSVPSEKYASWMRSVNRNQSGKKHVGGYPPWEYPLFAPFALLPMQYSFAIFTLLQLLALVACGMMAHSYAKRFGFGNLDSTLVAFSPVILATSIERCLNVGNFGILLGAVFFALAECLNRKNDFLSAIFLALLWIKPHLTLFVVIPLLLGRQYKPLILSGLLCAALSIPASIAVGKSPVALVLDVLMRHPDQTFRQLALLPGRLSIPLITCITPQGVLVLLFAVYSSAIVFLARRHDRRNCDWETRLAPCAVIAPVWAYSRSHDTAIYIFPVVVAATGLLAAIRCHAGIFGHHACINGIGRTPTRKRECVSALLYTVALLSLLTVIFHTGDTTRSPFPEFLAWRLYASRFTYLQAIGKWILCLPAKDHSLFPLYMLGNWTLLISWFTLFMKVTGKHRNFCMSQTES